MEAVDSLANLIPVVSPYKVVIAFFFIPFATFTVVNLIYSAVYKTVDDETRPYSYFKRFTWNFPSLYFKFSPAIGTLCIIWSLVVLIFQAAYIYKHLGIGTDLSYYLKIDIPEYETVDLINLAEDSYSLYYYLQDSFYNHPKGSSDVSFHVSPSLYFPFSTREQFDAHYKSLFIQDKTVKGETGKIEVHEDTSKFIYLKNQLQTAKKLFRSNSDLSFPKTEILAVNDGRRKLSSTTSLAFIYHTNNWENMLLEENLIAACKTEKNILLNVDCINTDGSTSLLQSVFNDNCEFSSSYSYAVETFTLPDNSDYVADGVDSSNPDSAVIGSLFKLGSCEDLSLDSFESKLEAQSTGGVHTVYISPALVQNAFADAIFNGVYISAIALIFGSLYILISVRGFLATLMTLYSILVSVVNAAAVLVDFQYGTFSAFNVLSIFILIGVGGNAVVMFGSSWREVIPTGKPPKLKHFIAAYDKISRPVLFTVCAATISLFSKLISPVIVISQLGAFMGVSVLVFYLCLHYIIIPMWLMSGWFHFSKGFHKCCGRLWYKITCRKPQSDEELGRFSSMTIEETNRPPAINPTLESNVVEAQLTVDDQGNYVYNVTENAVEVVPRDSEILRKKQIKYESPSLLKRFLLFTGLEKDSKSDNHDSDRGNAGANSRLYSPLLHEGDGGNYVNDSSHGLIVDSPESNIPPTVILGPTQPQSQQRGEGITTISPTVTSPVKKTVKSRRGKYALKCYSICVFIATLLGFLLVGYLIMIKYHLDLGIPQLFPEDSNMGQVLYIVKNYKASLLTSIDSAGSITVATPSPTSSPVLIPFTNRPTNRPVPVFTGSPTITPSRSQAPSFKPTYPQPSMKPSAAKPSLKPSAYPSVKPQPKNESSSYVDYTINTCWGLSSYKKYKDSDVNVTFDGATFMKYVNSGSIIKDMNSFCTYANQNKKDLNLNPTWNMNTDCIYNQVMESYYEIPPPQRNYTNALYYWGSKSTLNSKFLGLETTNPNDPNDLSAIRITWLCANYSARTYVSSLIDNPDLAADIQNKWDKAFHKYGATYSSKYSINEIVSSDEFSFPLLAQEVFLSIELAILISVIGFFGLLAGFGSLDFFIIFLGTIGMIAIFAIAICCHMYIFSSTLDLLDVVVLIAIIGIVVDLPIHFILHYQMERKKFHRLRAQLKRRIARLEEENQSEENLALTNNTGEESFRRRNSLLLLPTKTRDDRYAISAMKAAISPELNETNKYMRIALGQLLILTLICGIPLLFATFVLLQKTGQYIVIIAVVSYVFTIIILPYLLAMGFQTHVFKYSKKKICGWESKRNQNDDLDSYQGRGDIGYLYDDNEDDEDGFDGNLFGTNSDVIDASNWTVTYATAPGAQRYSAPPMPPAPAPHSSSSAPPLLQQEIQGDDVSVMTTQSNASHQLQYSQIYPNLSASNENIQYNRL